MAKICLFVSKIKDTPPSSYSGGASVYFMMYIGVALSMLSVVAVTSDGSDGGLSANATYGYGGSAVPSRYCLPLAQVSLKASGRCGSSKASPQSVAESDALKVRAPSSRSCEVSSSASPAIGISRQGATSLIIAIDVCVTMMAEAICRASQYSIWLI